MRIAVLATLLLMVSVAAGQTTQPAPAQSVAPQATAALGGPASVTPTSGGPTTAPSAAAATPEQLLNQMLHGADSQKNQILTPDGSVNSDFGGSAASGLAADAPAGAIMREGTEILDRVGRLQKSTDGQWEQFVFESDGRTLKDPPVFVLPNLTLNLMEKELTSVAHDLRFRITGTVTEYHGHNYILMEKVVVLQDKNQEF